jgi:hypothetical protein
MKARQNSGIMKIGDIRNLPASIITMSGRLEKRESEDLLDKSKTGSLSLAQ